VTAAAAHEDRASTFSTTGFVVLPGLLSAPRLQQARVAAEQAVDDPDGLSCERPHNTLVPLRWHSLLVELVLDAHDRIAGAVGARDLRWVSGYVSVKEPQSPPLWWHQDWWAWDHPVSFRREAAQVSVLCYLTDTTGATGALRVIPGSHAASVPLHGVLPEAHGDDSTALDLCHPAMTDHPDQLTLELHAGDAVVTDYRLLHGTHANAATNRRDCALLNFAPHWSDLPADIRAHLVSHPALPGADDATPPTALAELLPRFDGRRRDLPLNRNAPPAFTTGEI
jgi:ectoine hydroxylase-related dioxygenase (phytanoyl-CoA dioxygenase family)